MKRLSRKQKADLEAREYMRGIRKEIRAKMRQEKQALFDQTTLEQRREFIRLMHEGGPIKTAREAVGMEMEAAMVVYLRCLKKVSYTILIPTEDVK